MWLWYLELYLLTLIAFALGGGLGLLVVRLVVRRRADDPNPGAETAQETAEAGA